MKKAKASAAKKAAKKSPAKPRSAKPAAARKVPKAASAPAIRSAGAGVAAAPKLEKMGSLLREAVSGLAKERITGVARMAIEAVAADDGGGGAEPVMPISIATPRITPLPDEKWDHYKQRVADVLGPIGEWLDKNAGLKTLPSFSSAGFSCQALMGQLEEASKHNRVSTLELDPPRILTLMDDVAGDLELPLFLSQHPNLDGSGIRVAVLDSGIDLLHPWLQVADSVETCGESVDFPGAHGTHVAGSIASRDTVYRGVAPAVTLINVKVLDQLGRGNAGQITRGIDAALDKDAQILSMSVGFNHLPTWSQGGHGWSCPDGRCELCTAVNNAVQLDGVFVVVAAGNEHRRAEFLRQTGNGDRFDSEIACPGSAAGALTVGAITKQTFLTADFSSRGPTSYGANKPDIAAPGVNIRSSIPARRIGGQLAPDLLRGDLSGPNSGTSMATPIVSGVVALILQRRLAAGLTITPFEVRTELLTNGFRHLAGPASEVGIGRLNAATL